MCFLVVAPDLCITFYQYFMKGKIVGKKIRPGNDNIARIIINTAEGAINDYKSIYYAE